jgi:hypothetical protein
MKTITKISGGLLGAIVLVSCFSYMFVRSPVVDHPRKSSNAFYLPPDTPDKPVLFDAVDRVLQKLEFGNIAFNVPQTMRLRDTAVIELLLSVATPTDELKRMIEAAGEKEGARIRVSERMEARLSGPNFAITAITPELQAVSRHDITQWKWEVKPSRDGHQYLHLTLSALLSVDAASTPRALRTFDKMIEVEVSWPQQVGSFFEQNWQWLWATVCVPIVGWLWKKKKGANPDGSPHGPDVT